MNIIPAITIDDQQFLDHPSFDYVSQIVKIDTSHLLLQTRPEFIDDKQAYAEDELVDTLRLLSAKNLALSDKHSTTRESILEHIKNTIRSTQFPQKWKEEGINEPSEKSTAVAFSIAEKIYDDFCKIPLRINPSIEEGVILFYWVSKKNKSLKIETYNTDETVGLINENRTIVQSTTIRTNEDLKQLCDKFFSN